MNAKLLLLGLWFFSGVSALESRAGEYAVDLPFLLGTIGEDPVIGQVELPAEALQEGVLSARVAFSAVASGWIELCNVGEPDEITTTVQPFLYFLARDTACPYHHWRTTTGYLEEGLNSGEPTLFWTEPPHPFGICIEDWAFAAERPLEVQVWAMPSTLGSCTYLEQPLPELVTARLVLTTSTVTTGASSWAAVKARY